MALIIKIETLTPQSTHEKHHEASYMAIGIYLSADTITSSSKNTQIAFKARSDISTQLSKVIWMFYGGFERCSNKLAYHDFAYSNVHKYREFVELMLEDAATSTPIHKFSK